MKGPRQENCYNFHLNPVRFSYCVPYTYSQMLVQIQLLKQKNPQRIHLGSIGKSLTGVDIPYVAVSQDSQQQEKPILVCIGRLHPGQTNGSHVLSGFLNFLACSPEASYLRSKIFTIFIPMINPDGVIIGNSRTGAIGKDLNRQFKTRNKFIFPEVCCLKQFCQKISESGDIEMFLDFHGHSKKKNMFFFGPSYNITQPQYYRSRIVPKILSQITPIFRYFGCDYSIPVSKSTTARAVMLQQLNIPYVYAIQTSIGQYFDYESHKVLPFFLKKWLELGADIGKALKQYFQSIQQFAQFTKLKQNSDNQLPVPTKDHKNSEKQKIPKTLVSKPTISPDKNKRFILKDIKLIKVIQQIKTAEEEKRTSKKKIEESDNDSDSSNQEDNLQGKKRAQFESMISQCIQTQKIRQQRQNEFQDGKFMKLRKDESSRLRRKRQKIKGKQQNNLMKQLLKSININNTIGQNDKAESSTKIVKNTRSRERGMNKNVECANKYTSRQSYIFSQENKTSRLQYQDVIANNPYFHDNIPQNLDKTKKNNVNLRMFNFSKIIEKTSDRTVVTTGRYGRNRVRVNIKQINTISSEKDRKNEEFFQSSSPGQYFNKVSLETGLAEIRSRQQEDLNRMKQYNSARKMKGLFPAHFYRIKYHNYQKKRKYFEQLREQIEQAEEQSFPTYSKSSKKRESLFLNIKKVNQPTNN